MKLKFHAGAVKHDRHDRPKRKPFSSFRLAASSLALLSAFSFGPTLFPKQAAAQDPGGQPSWPATIDTSGVLGDVMRRYYEDMEQYGKDHPAERQTTPRAVIPALDSAKPAPAADTTKPSANAASDSAHPTLPWEDKGLGPLPVAAKDTTPLSAPAIAYEPDKPEIRMVVLRPFLSVGTALAYDPDIVTGIKSVPVGVRDVPVHPDDLRLGSGTDWSAPIGNRSGDFHVSNGGVCEMFAGLDLSFYNGLAAIVFGAGYAVRSSGDSSIFNERNYLNSMNSPDTGSSTSYVRGSGTALTYYTVSYDGGSLCLFTEAKVAASRRLSFGLGYKMYWEQVSATSGWDRYNSLQEWNSSGVASLAVKMPYAFAEFRLDPPEENCIVKTTLRGFFGAKYASYTYIMPSTELILRKTPLYSFGIRVNFKLIKGL